MKELDLAAYAWEIQLLKRLGYTPDDGKDTKVKDIHKFAEANIPDFKNHIIPDKNGKKNKPELMLALSKFVRVQQPDKHWIDSDGKPFPLIAVPENYVLKEAEAEPGPEPEEQESEMPVAEEETLLPMCAVYIPCLASLLPEPDTPAAQPPVLPEPAREAQTEAPGAHQ